MSGGVVVETKAKWSFGLQSAAEGGAVLGSTGAGTRVDVRGQAREHGFYVETDAGATCSYQILTARTATGPSAILSSGTLTSNATAYFQATGPFSFVFPRIKTLTSTAVNVTVELVGN